MKSKKTRVLILGSTSDPNSLELKYYRAFKKIHNISVDIKEIEKRSFFRKKFLQKYFIIFFLYYYSTKLIFFLKNKKRYDLVLIFKGLYYSNSCISFLRKKYCSTFFFNIDGDDPFNTTEPIISNKEHLESLKYYHHVFFWSKKIKDKFLKKYPSMRNNTKILYFAHENYKIQNYFRFKNFFLFYGSWDRNREKFLNSLSINNLKIFGNGWGKSSPNFKFRKVIYSEISGKKLIKTISSSLGVINLFRRQNKNSINMRVFEVLSSGGLLVTENSKMLKKILNFKKFYFEFCNLKNCNKILVSINKKAQKKFYYKGYRKLSIKSLIKYSYVNNAKKIINQLNIAKKDSS